MVAGVMGWIVENFLTPCTSLKGEVEKTVEVDWIVGKNQGTSLTIRIVIGVGASLKHFFKV